MERKKFFSLLYGRIRNAKIRIKLFVLLVFAAIFCGTVIGAVSYHSMRLSLIDEAQQSTLSLLKKGGAELDDKIQEFQNATYSMGTSSDITDILNNGEDINQWLHSLQQSSFISQLLTYNILYENTAYAIMKSESGNIYFYDLNKNNSSINSIDKDAIVEALEDTVTDTSPIKWLSYEGQEYFVRRIVENSDGHIERLGTLIFAVNDNFFLCGDDSNPFISNGNVVITDVGNNICKNIDLSVTDEFLKSFLNYNDGSYYTYTVDAQFRGEKYLVVPLRTKTYQWNMVCIIPYDVILERANQVVIKVVITTLIVLFICLLAFFVFYRSIRKNLGIIETGIHQYESGDYSRLAAPARYDELGMVIEQFSDMGVKIQELNEQAIIEQEKMQKLQYQVLETQINPHFLYNTLETLKWLAYEQGAYDTSNLADAIIKLLRFTVKNANKWVTFGEEVEYVKQYIFLQEVRYDHAFQAVYDITEEAGNFRCVSFILQPFIENSILHGLDTSRSDGLLQIKSFVKENKLNIILSDNGLGMKEELIQNINEKVQEKALEEYKGFNGIGVVNILLRLKLIYGDEFQYEIKSQPGQGTEIYLYLPEREANDDDTNIGG